LAFRSHDMQNYYYCMPLLGPEHALVVYTAASIILATLTLAAGWCCAWHCALRKSAFVREVLALDEFAPTAVAAAANKKA